MSLDELWHKSCTFLYAHSITHIYMVGYLLCSVLGTYCRLIERTTHVMRFSCICPSDISLIFFFFFFFLFVCCWNRVKIYFYLNKKKFYNILHNKYIKVKQNEKARGLKLVPILISCNCYYNIFNTTMKIFFACL